MTKNKALKIVVPIVIILLIICVICISVMYYKRSKTYENIQYATSYPKSKITLSNIKNEEEYKKTTDLISSLSLDKFYTGHTVYFTKDSNPFIISGSEPVYLKSEKNHLTLGDGGIKDIKTQEEGKPLIVLNSEDYEKEETNKKEALEAENRANKETVLIVDLKDCGNVQIPHTLKNGIDFYELKSIVHNTGLEYSSAKSAITLDYKNKEEMEIRKTIDIATLENQPWTDEETKEIYPAIKIIDNNYYIAGTILNSCFNINIKYNKENNYVDVKTEFFSDDKPLVVKDYSINKDHVITIQKAKALKIIDDHGTLSNNAIKIHDDNEAQEQKDAKLKQQQVQEGEMKKQQKLDDEKKNKQKKIEVNKNKQVKAVETKKEENTKISEPIGFKGASFNNCSQVIVVTTDRMKTINAKTDVYEKNGNVWNKIMSNIPSKIGKNGLVYSSQRKQNTDTTPAGVFGFKFAFGIAGNPGTAMQYKQINGNSYWDENSGSPTYNRWVDKNPGGDNEYLCAQPYYKYAVAIDYNWNQVPSKGGGIFLHIMPSFYTGGCVGIPESNLVNIIKWLNPSKNPKIVIIPKSDFSKYYH